MKKLFFVLVVALGISSCASTSHVLTPNSATVTEQITKNGYFLQEIARYHTAAGQNDTIGVLFFGPDSVANKIVQSFIGDLKTKAPK